MRKTKFLLSALLCSSFGLTACDINDILAQVGIGEKKVVEDNENENQGTSTGEEDQGGQSGDQGGGQGGGQGGQTGGETTITLQYLEDLIKPMAAAVFQMGQDQLEFIDYDDWDIDENYQNVLYSYEQENLVFAGFYDYPDLDDWDDTIDQYVPLLEAQLPSNAVKDEERSSQTDPEYPFYFDWYKVGDLYYVIYADDDYFVYSLDIVPQSQADAYLDYAYTEEDNSTDYDNYDDSDIDWESLLAESR